MEQKWLLGIIYIIVMHKLLYNIKYRFFEKLGDVSSALNFLVLSHCQEEAFTMAQVRMYDEIKLYSHS